MNNETNNAVTAFPLVWPVGWVRTVRGGQRRAAFSKAARKSGESWISRRSVSVNDATEFLRGELRRLGVSGNYVISTNLKLRIDGQPYSNLPEPGDSGAAVYFKLRAGSVVRDQVLACDKWNRVADNIMAIAKHIEAMRAQDRWGVGSIEQAFNGYLALPMETTRPWWVVLDISKEGATPESVNAAYKRKAMTCHPDRGGSADEWNELQRAQDVALKAVGA